MWQHSRQMSISVVVFVILAFLGSWLPQVFSFRAFSNIAQSTRQCNEHCGNFSIPYPFYINSRRCGMDGFILQCHNNAVKIEVNKLYYNVVSLLSDGIIIDPLRSSCSKNLKDFNIKGMRNYAISVNNFLQFSDCKNSIHCELNCNIPMQSRNEQCMFDRTCCYPLLNETIWHIGDDDFAQFSRLQCQSFISWVFTPSLTNFDAVYGLKLEWGILGTCDDVHCDPDAVCEHGVALKKSVRCTCKPGYEGDGFVQGTGCVRGGPNTGGPNKSAIAIGGPNKSAIAIGCSIGGVALTAIALVVFLKLYGKRRKQPAVEKFLSDYAYEMPARYSLSQLKKITNDFAEKLGEGGFGVVYKGKLRNGTLVAVKLLDRHRHSESTQFMNEVATIGRLHHVNLVRLLGYCFESPTSALVYEYMVNGSLEKIIFAGKEKGQILMWEQLHSIALGAARGIAYLHQDCEKRIIHFDIKPHNILLDADFAPKVSDFGLAKLCEKGDDHISMSAARGTPGYVAPELCDTDHSSVTDKADVYSFGVLLLEIVGGRKNIDWKVSRSSQFYFPEWAFKLLESGELGMRLRRGGEMEAEDEEKARRLTKVGLWCIQCNYRDRPSMSRVVQMLEGNGDDVANPPLPLNSPIAAPENPLLPSTQRSYSSM